MVKVVSFDVVGTLVDAGYEDYVWNEAIPRLYARKKNISHADAQDYVRGEYDRLGTQDLRWFLPEYWFRRFGLDEDPVAVFSSHRDKVTFYPEVPAVLRHLSHEYDLIVTSGTTRAIIEIMVKKVRHYFKHTYSTITDRQEVEKTPQLYEAVCKDLEVAPCELVHVGDKWDPDFIAPRRAGCSSVLIERTGKRTGNSIVKNLGELENLLQQLRC